MPGVQARLEEATGLRGPPGRIRKSGCDAGRNGEGTSRQWKRDGGTGPGRPGPRGLAGAERGEPRGEGETKSRRRGRSWEEMEKGWRGEGGRAGRGVRTWRGSAGGGAKFPACAPRVRVLAAGREEPAGSGLKPETSGPARPGGRKEAAAAGRAVAGRALRCRGGDPSVSRRGAEPGAGGMERGRGGGAGRGRARGSPRPSPRLPAPRRQGCPLGRTRRAVGARVLCGGSGGAPLPAAGAAQWPCSQPRPASPAPPKPLPGPGRGRTAVRGRDRLIGVVRPQAEALRPRSGTGVGGGAASPCAGAARTR